MGGLTLIRSSPIDRQMLCNIVYLKMIDQEITGKIIGASMKVHSALGCGFQEVIYQRALGIELAKQGVSHEREVEMDIYYSGEHVGTRRVEFLVDGRISVELKAISNLEDVHLAQGINYLEAYNLQSDCSSISEHLVCNSSD